MLVKCQKCGTEVSLDKEATCPKCRRLLRRCADCTQYNVRLSVCNVDGRQIDTGEASYPTYASSSTYCRSYAFKAA